MIKYKCLYNHTKHCKAKGLYQNVLSLHFPGMLWKHGKNKADGKHYWKCQIPIFLHSWYFVLGNAVISFTLLLPLFMHIFNFIPLNNLTKFPKIDHNFRVERGDENLQDLECILLFSPKSQLKIFYLLP